MESTPHTPEDDDDDKDSSKSRKQDAKALGAFAVEPKTPDTRQSRPREGLLGMFNRESAKEDTSESEVSDVEQSGDSTEAEEVLAADTLTEMERVAIEQQIVAARLHETPQPDDTPAVIEAIDGFHHKIIDEGQPSDQALIESLDEIEAAESEPEVAESEAELHEDDELLETVPASDVPLMEFSEEPIIIERNDETPSTSTTSQRTTPQTSPIVSSSSIESTPRTSTSESTSRPSSETIVDGMVGYLVGRRRGRINAESRLIPVQQKLEKQVTDLQANIVAKEAAIRNAVITRESVRSTNQPQTAEATPSIFQTAETAAIPAAELHRTMLSARPEQQPAAPAAEIAPTMAVDKHVETMRRQDLLELAGKIQVEGTTLRRIFESHLVSEKGLRRVIAEHLRGGNVIKALKLEMTEHQIDFERDPYMRDQTPVSSSATTAQPTLDDLLAKADIPADYEATHRTSAAQDPATYDNAFRGRDQQAKRLADTAMITVIVVLALAIITLVLMRR